MPKNVRINWKPQKVRKAERGGAIQGLRKASEHLLGESRKQVPHETGALEASGVAQVDERGLSASVSYDTPYAVRQHEEIDYVHKGKPGAKAKYLEDPATTESATLHELVAAEIRRSLR